MQSATPVATLESPNICIEDDHSYDSSDFSFETQNVFTKGKMEQIRGQLGIGAPIWTDSTNLLHWGKCVDIYCILLNVATSKDKQQIEEWAFNLKCNAMRDVRKFIFILPSCACQIFFGKSCFFNH